MSKVRFADIPTPAPPAAGKTFLYIDETDGHAKTLDSSGTTFDLTRSGGGSGVDDVNSVTGSVIITGAGEVVVSTAGQTITISGTPHVIDTDTDTVSNAIIGGVGITVTSGTSITTLDGHIRYTSAENDAITGSDGVTVISGVNTIELVGFRTEFVNASGTLSAEIDSDISTHAADTDAHHARYTDSEAISATESARFTMSGTLSAEIDSDISTHAAISDAHHSRYTDSEAITALEPTTSQLAASGVATDATFTSHAADISAHHTRYTKNENDALIGGTNVTVASGTGIITISSVGGGGSVPNALVGSDGITVTSGDPTDDIAGFRGEFVNASGTLSTQITDDIATHTEIANAHHDKYTDAEAISALEPTTSALAASGVATDANVTTNAADIATNVTDISALTTSGVAQDVLIAANSAEILTVSGSLQSSIDAVEGSDVDDINSLIGSITVIGKGEVGVTVEGQNIVVSGTPHETDTDTDTVSDALIGGTGITVTSGSNTTTIDGHVRYTSDENDAITGSDGNTVVSGSNTIDVAGFRAEFVATSGALQTDIDAIDDHARYTDAEAISALEPTTSALAASGVATDANVTTNATDIGALTTSGVAQDVLIAANTALTVSVSGHLQGEIDATQPDVDSLNSLTGDLDVIGKGTVGVTVEGTNIVVSGTDHTAGGSGGTVSDALIGADGLTVTSGSNTTTLTSFRPEFVAASGALQTDIDAIDDHAKYTDAEAVTATESARFTMSGTLSAEIDSDVASHAATASAHHTRYTKNENDALIGGTNVTVTSGSNIITIDASGSFSNEPDIDAINTVTGSLTLGGADGITIVDDTIDSATPVLTVSGFRTEFVNASGTLSAEIDSDITTHATDANAHHTRYSREENDAIIGGTNVTVVSGVNTITINSTGGGGGGTVSDAMVGTDGITVLSGTPTTSETTISGFRDEFLSASGTLVKKTGDTMTGDLDISAAQLIVASGTTSAPGIYFAGDPNTGIMSTAPDSVSFAAGGMANFTVSASLALFSVPLRAAGTGPATPQYSFAFTSTTGMYQDGLSAIVGLSTNGISGLEIDTGQIVDIPVGLTVSGIPVRIDPKGTNTKNIAVEDPTNAEDISWFFTPIAITVTEVTAVNVGSSPSVTISIMHNTDRNAAGNNVLTSATAITNTTTGQNPAIGGDVTIPIDSFIWLETSAQSGTVDILLVSITYTED